MKRPKAKYGTCCITISHRVPVKAVFKGWSDVDKEYGEIPEPLWDYKLLKSKIKGEYRVTKEDIIHFFGIDGELDDTFEKQNI